MTHRGTGAFSHAPPPRPRAIVLVFVGGVVGTALRWLVTTLLPIGAIGAGTFSWGTLAVDLTGSLILGLLLAVLARQSRDPAAQVTWRLLLGTGFCGAFTTYSAMALEVSRFVHEGRMSAAVAWLSVTVIGGVGCAAAGAWLGSRKHRGAA